MKKLGIYIHVPFCLSKCKYCGFYSHGGASEAEQTAYVESLVNDIEEYGRVYGEEYIVDTVFIGGGTPSILPSPYIGEILGCIYDCFTVDEGAEISMESNPKTLTYENLLAYRKAGVNRLSIGVQSLNDDCLKALGRVHTAADFKRNFIMAREAGFDNINMDLMFAIPGHTMEVWEETLDEAISLGPEHISFYSLQIEEGTPFYDMYRRGEFDQVPDDIDREMYHRGIAKLKAAGYNHYEISNACKPGWECRHNLKYWSMEDYLGIGPSASSYMKGIRFAEAPLMEFHENTQEDDMSEFVFTGLRKTNGISFDDFTRRFGRNFWDVFGDRRAELVLYIESGHLVETGEGLRLSEEGLDISNAIMAVFI
ncbi:MAG: radical SAM family heme chaperone HemW [Firmicutes bacterium]|nr:radical SAM family heme chaperone HemW [Bacillota bacterium]